MRVRLIELALRGDLTEREGESQRDEWMSSPGVGFPSGAEKEADKKSTLQGNG